MNASHDLGHLGMEIEILQAWKEEKKGGFVASC